MQIKPTEHDEQAALFEWAAFNVGHYPALRLLYAIPNGGLRNVVVAKKLKDEGVKAGMPDICLPVARHGYHGLYLELKTREGKVSKEQKRRMMDLRSEGYDVFVAYGWDMARSFILDYLTLSVDEETADR